MKPGRKGLYSPSILRWRPPDKAKAEAEQPVVPDAAPAAEAPPAPETDDKPAEATADSNPTVEETTAVQYWRWKGMARKNNRDHGKNRGKPQKHAKGAPAKRKAEPVLATAGGAFAELAALRDSMKK